MWLIAEITEVKGKEKLVPFSALWFFLHKLQSIHLIQMPNDSNVIEQIKHAWSQVWPERSLFRSRSHLIACSLVPCFKSLSFLSEDERNGVLLSVEEKAVGIKLASNSSDAKNAEKSIDKHRQKRLSKRKIFSFSNWKISWISQIQQILPLKSLQTRNPLHWC